MNITEYPALPQTAEAWASAFSAEFPRWQNVRPADVARIILNALEQAPSLDEISDEQINEYILRPMHNEAGYHSGYGSERTRSADDERVAAWLTATIEEGVNGGDSAEDVTPEKEDGEVDIDLLVSRVAPMLEKRLDDNGTPQRYAQIVEVLTYQYRNWKRGKYVVPTVRRAVQQFNRRMNRQHDWSLNSGYGQRFTEQCVTLVAEYLMKFAKGETPRLLPVPPRQEDIEARFREENITFTDYDGTYYPAFVGYRISQAWRRDGEPTEGQQFEDQFRSTLERNVSIDRVTSYLTDEFYKNAHSALVELTFGTAITLDPVEGVTDYESLVAWMIGLHEDAGSLQKDAIRDGLADWWDTVRSEPEKIDEEGAVETLRRQVIAYGFSRFTGKESRATLRATLSLVVESGRGVGLTLDEWKTRWARRDKAVSYVSGRYGEEQNLCQVLEKATKELGIKPTRKPKHMVRFEGSGLLVEVEVESWVDDQYRLQNSARERWGTMTDAEKEAAVVKRTGVYVDWGNMSVAR